MRVVLFLRRADLAIFLTNMTELVGDTSSSVSITAAIGWSGGNCWALRCALKVMSETIGRSRHPMIRSAGSTIFDPEFISSVGGIHDRMPSPTNLFDF